jgi:hypothetical protein
MPAILLRLIPPLIGALPMPIHMRMKKDIIDDKHMYFSLLTIDLDKAQQDRADPDHRSRRTSSNLDFHVVLEIEDDTGETIRKFKKVIRHLSAQQIQIREIVKESELPDQPIQRRVT